MNKLIEFKNKEGEVLRGIFSDEGGVMILFCAYMVLKELLLLSQSLKDFPMNFL